jgi:hypothetical protein
MSTSSHWSFLISTFLVYRLQNIESPSMWITVFCVQQTYRPASYLFCLYDVCHMSVNISCLHEVLISAAQPLIKVVLSLNDIVLELRGQAEDSNKDQNLYFDCLLLKIYYNLDNGQRNNLMPMASPCAVQGCDYVELIFSKIDIYYTFHFQIKHRCCSFHLFPLNVPTSLLEKDWECLDFKYVHIFVGPCF